MKILLENRKKIDPDDYLTEEELKLVKEAEKGPFYTEEEFLKVCPEYRDARLYIFRRI